MPHVTRLGNEESPTWDAVRSRLVGLTDGRSVSLDVDDDSFLIVLFVADLGYLVNGCAPGERDYFALVERGLGDDIVTAFDGGDTRTFPRHAFVSPALMLRVAERYYRTGERDPDCEWVDDRNATYD
jgi:hypothetical protein